MVAAWQSQQEGALGSGEGTPAPSHPLPLSAPKARAGGAQDRVGALLGREGGGVEEGKTAQTLFMVALITKKVHPKIA